MKVSRFGTFLATAAVVAMAPSAFAQRLANVTIQSTPPGATVRVDSATAAPLGVTPLPVRRSTTRIPQGQHRLFYTLDGYVPQTLDVTVAARNTRPFAVTLVQAGSIYVTSNATGARVFLDGNEVGTAPGRINGVAPGQHVVEVRQEGRRDVRETVSVTSGQVTSLTANMVSPTGTIRVVVSNMNGDIPADLRVTLDGTPVTGNPPQVDNVQPGTHILQVSAARFRSVRREVVVAEGQSQNIAVDLEAAAATGGTVRVLVPNVPGLQVFLDGEAITGTPPQRADVPAGRHSVRVTAPSGEFATAIDVTAGQQTNVEVTAGQITPARGRITVRSSTPGARVYIDGTEAGPAPYEHDIGLGEHAIVVRAEGFTDGSRTCTVTQAQGCELSVTLDRVAAPGGLRVVAVSPRGRPIPNATVRIGDRAPGPIGDLANLPPGQLTITVEAPNYAPATQNVEIVSGQMGEARITLQRTGLTGADVARRRAGISTFGAAPLVRGDAAFDLLGAFGGVPVEFRATLGLVPYGSIGPFVVDGGIAIRSRLNWWEIEIRSRAGVRVFNDTFAFGGELRGYAALGSSSTNGFGMTAQLNASAQFNLTSDDSVDEDADVRTRVNRLGAFAITLNLGVEVNSDNLTSDWNPNLTPPGGGNALTLCENFDASTQAGQEGQGLSSCTLQTTVRPFLGGVIEFGIARHLSAFIGLQYFLSNPAERLAGQSAAQVASDNESRRPLTTSTWDEALRAVIRFGVTYKF